jgi:hypothetical protein
LEERKALFQFLANEVDGDHLLAFDLSMVMAHNVPEMANALIKKATLKEEKQSSLSLEPKVIRSFN